ncbi:MAG TPA: hypothetical protein VLE89_01445 [Chlamydiales bacterium]|nr:hypothetical protein [Chlamydiales bacterium]
MFCPSVAFATACWEKDWRLILLDPDYLRIKQIGNHRYPFSEKLLIINNVKDLDAVIRAAQAKVNEGVLTRFIIAEEAMLEPFGLKRSDFTEWQYYNALAPLAAIHSCQSDYLLYHTGDVYLSKPVNWIPKAICRMEKNPNYKVANLTWNERYQEAKKESDRRDWSFYVAKQGFSDQQFLVKRIDFHRPIYGEIHLDSNHYPRGDVFEKRVFSYMKNRGWERITFRWGSYTHENVG